MATEAKPLSYAIPDHLRKTLKRGEYAVYQLADVVYKDGKFYGRTAGVPNKDVILDDKTGELIPIAFVEGHNPDGTARLGSIWFPIETECRIICLPGAKHAGLYNFLEISNYNESNPLRDPNTAPQWRRVDSTNDARQTREQRKQRVDALKAVISMTDEELDKFLDVNQKLIGVKLVSLPDGKRDYEAIRENVERWAEKNPSRFFALTESAGTQSDEGLQELVDWAIAEKLITLDRETKTWYDVNGKPVLKVRSIKDGLPEVELISFLRSSAGEKLYFKIKKARS
jgi:hypothetical protein